MKQLGALYFLLCLLMFAACDADYVVVSLQSDPSLPPPRSTGGRSSMAQGPEGHGRFIGVVRIRNIDYFGDALVTDDGHVRLYVGGPHAHSGSLQVTRPDSSMQFVGTIDLRNGGVFGNGVILTEGCVPAASDCAGAVPAEINVARITREMRGEIRSMGSDADEIWSLDLAQWDNYYARPAAIASMAGQYEELITELSQQTRTLIRIDERGQLSFQDAQAGCTGRGTLAPRSNGQFSVYDVELHIEACDALHASLNGDLEGMAAESASSVWSYDSFLRIWLTTRDETGSPVAVTLLASRW
jgi:hypothetical protein